MITIRRQMRRLTLLAVLTLSLGAAACGSDEDSGSESGGTTTATTEKADKTETAAKTTEAENGKAEEKNEEKKADSKGGKQQNQQERKQRRDPTKAAGEPTAYQGVYRATFTKSKAHKPVGQPGQWTLRFAGTTLTARVPNTKRVLGMGSPVDVEDGTLSLKPAQLCGRQVNGTYKVSFENNQLRFTGAQDRCERRRVLLTQGKWRKIGT
jgi:hypothetical protein